MTGTNGRRISEEERLTKIAALEGLAAQIKLNIKSYKRPLVVEFSGLPKAGKTTAVSSLALFLRRNNIPTKVITEKASICPIRTKDHPFFNVWTACQTLSDIIEALQSEKHHVIVVDRGIFDAFVWMLMLRNIGALRDEELDTIRRFLFLPRWAQQVDVVFHMVADVDKALEREFKDLLTQKEGSIMNERVLHSYLTASDEAVQECNTCFSKFLTIDTTETAPIEAVEEITNLVLTALKELSDEELVVVNKSYISENLQHIGFAPTSSSALQFIDKVLSSRAERHRRSEAERMFDFIQFVIIGVLTYDEKVLVYTKKEISPQERFHEKRIIWAGGHLRWDDITAEDSGVEEKLLRCLRRELEEELHLSGHLDFVLKGFIYDNSSVRSLQHLGVVFHAEISDPQLFGALNEKTFREYAGQELKTEFVPLDPLDRVLQLTFSESWSADILHQLFGLDIPESARMVQQVLPL